MGLFSPNQKVSFCISGENWELSNFKCERCIPNEPFFYSAAFALGIAWYYSGLSGANKLYGEVYLNKLFGISKDKSVEHIRTISDKNININSKYKYSITASDRYNTYPPRIKMPFDLDPKHQYIAPLRYIELIYRNIDEKAQKDYCELIQYVYHLSSTQLGSLENYNNSYTAFHNKFNEVLDRD